MMRVIGGIIQRFDRERGEVMIGGETLPLLPGMTIELDVPTGTSVTVLVRERDGHRHIVQLVPNLTPRFDAKAS